MIRAWQSYRDLISSRRMRLGYGLAWWVLWLCALCVGAAEEKLSLIIEPVDPAGQLQYDINTGAATATRGVRVRYGAATLTAREITVNEATGEVAARGDVRIEHGQLVWRAEEVRYNLTTGDLKTGTFRFGHAPFFAVGEAISRRPTDETNVTYQTERAFVTTDESDSPGYRVVTRRLTVVPGKFIEAHHAVVYLGKVPVFYFPYYRRSLDRHPNYWELTPGYRSLYGPYLLSSYHWMVRTNLEVAVNIDYRQKRGVGTGPDLLYDAGRWGQGLFRAYYVHDEDPGRDFEERLLPENRWRLYYSHFAQIDTNLSARVMVRKWSDLFMTRDFFEGEYRTNIQPITYLNLNRQQPNFSLDLLVQPRLNSFFETVERLPDVKLSVLRTQVGVLPIYYEGETSAGYFQRRFAHTDTNDFRAFRGDSFHQLLLPTTLLGWLNFTPRIGGRVTHYGEADGRGLDTDQATRAVFNTGAEVSFKASRVWRSVESRAFEANELRHIFEPSVNYVYVPSPTVRPPDLPQFDYELESYRLLPVMFPDYNSIDSIDSQNVLRLSLRNKLQTKRPAGIENIVNWALYTDWRLKTRRDQHSFADLYSDLDFKPRSWITFNSEVRFDFGIGQWRQLNHRLTLTPNDVWSWEIGHRYLRDDLAAYGLGNNLITSRVYCRLNENWGFRMTHHFEARDGKMEEQYYTIYRDLRSWTSALTFRIRESRQGPTDFGVAVTFSLKAFPRFKLGDDRERPSMLLGG